MYWAQKEAEKGFSKEIKKEFILNKDYKNNLLSKMMWKPLNSNLT